MAGRYLGLLLAVALALVGFAVVFLITLRLAGGTLTSSDLVALLAILPEAAILGGFGLVLSAFSTPTLSTGIGLGFWMAAATTDDLVGLTANADLPLKLVAKAAYYVLPSFARLDFRDAAVYQASVAPAEVGYSLAYGMLYAVGLVALASVILTRREMV